MSTIKVATMETVISVDKLSKAYQIGQISTGTLARDLERWVARIRGKEDPFLTVGETNDRTSKGKTDVVWSLKDISFELKRGEAVGIIGRNGAGKSTLLKVLSRVTSPSSGDIRIRGRIASLLEVGTGFHPDLTGRENIYLNGAILGMRKKEITRKLDEIIDFAGVARYIDTPVKKYSSGMYVRLAFAVAAHLESEILIVDEVLAVGDAEFQNKCLGKMGEVASGQGKTVLFVSHNMSSIAALCRSGLLLENGRLKLAGTATECIKSYHNPGQVSGSLTSWTATNRKFFDRAFSLSHVQLEDKNGSVISDGLVDYEHKLILVIDGEVEEISQALKVGYELLDSQDNLVFTALSTDRDPKEWPRFSVGKNTLKTEIPIHFLYPGKYYVRIHISLQHQKWICNPKEGSIELAFKLTEANLDNPYGGEKTGLVKIRSQFVSRPERSISMQHRAQEAL